MLPSPDAASLASVVTVTGAVLYHPPEPSAAGRVTVMAGPVMSIGSWLDGLDVTGMSGIGGNFESSEIDEPCDLFELRVVDLGGRISRGVIVRMKSGEKEYRRNALRKE